MLVACCCLLVVVGMWQLELGPGGRVRLLHLDLDLGGEEVDDAGRERLDHAVQVELFLERLGAVLEHELDTQADAVGAHRAARGHRVLGIDGEHDEAARLMVVVAALDLLHSAAAAV